MASPLLDRTHSRQRRAWQAITALGQHIRLNAFGCGMPSSPFGSTHSRTTSGVACHHHLWAAQMVKRRQAWNAIIAFRLAHTVGRRRAWHAIVALGRQTRSNDVRRGMPSSPLAVRAVEIVGRGMSSWHLDTTHDRTKSVVACHHSPLTATKVE